MSVGNILFSQSHLCHPFTISGGPVRIHLSTSEKILSVGASLLFGALTFGVGGVAMFYTTTAAMKAMKLRNMPVAFRPIFTPIKPFGMFKRSLGRFKARFRAKPGVVKVQKFYKKPKVQVRKTLLVTPPVITGKPLLGILKTAGKRTKAKGGIKFGVVRDRKCNKRQAPSAVAKVSSIEIRKLDSHDSHPAREIRFR